MKTRASMLRRDRRREKYASPDTPPKPTSNDFVLSDVVLSPAKLPTPWLYDSEKLLEDLDRVRECVLRIPLTLDAHGPINVALCAVWELRQRLSYLIGLRACHAGRLESACGRKGKTRDGSNRCEQSSPSRRSARRAAKKIERCLRVFAFGSYEIDSKRYGSRHGRSKAARPLAKRANNYALRSRLCGSGPIDLTLKLGASADFLAVLPSSAASRCS
jgi:hypothetical protein